MTAIPPNEEISTDKWNGFKLAYHILNLLSGFLELGCVVFLIVSQENIIHILLAGLSYQIGNLAASTVKISKRGILVIGFLSVIFLSIYFQIGAIQLYFVSIVFISIALQKVRRLIVSAIGSEGVSTFSKRAVRIAGFLVAGFASGLLMFIVYFGVVIVTSYMALQHNQWGADFSAIGKTRGNTLSSIMIIHQSHYFSYAYWIPILFIYKLGISHYLVGLFFIIGWLSYIFSEKLFGGLDEIKVFMLGHLTVAISLVLLGLFSNSLPTVLIAWFISGLGGGTVFCLKRLNKRSIEKTDLDIWEDIGHVSGVLASIILAIVFADWPGNPFFASALIAAITALTMFAKKGIFVK